MQTQRLPASGANDPFFFMTCVSGRAIPQQREDSELPTEETHIASRSSPLKFFSRNKNWLIEKSSSFWGLQVNKKRRSEGREGKREEKKDTKKYEQKRCNEL